MKRRTKIAAAREKRRAQRAAGMRNPGGQSNYGRKKRWLDSHGMFGFEVLPPKPWRSAS